MGKAQRNQKWLRKLEFSRANQRTLQDAPRAVIGQAMLFRVIDTLSNLTGRWQQYDGRRDPAAKR